MTLVSRPCAFIGGGSRSAEMNPFLIVVMIVLTVLILAASFCAQHTHAADLQAFSRHSLFFY